VNKTDALLSQILRRDRTIAIVGLSANEHRPSHVVATYLQAKGYRIVPVNPRSKIEHARLYGDLHWADINND